MEKKSGKAPGKNTEKQKEISESIAKLGMLVSKAWDNWLIHRKTGSITEGKRTIILAGEIKAEADHLKNIAR
jgi:hypothetical protein